MSIQDAIRKATHPSRRRVLGYCMLGASLPLWTMPRALQAADAATLPEPGRPMLLRGGVVLSMDPALGDFDEADVLVEDGRIVEVAPGISHAEAHVVDAAGMIVMPGFVDTHRHMWQGQLRNSLPDGTLLDYIREITGNARRHYRPEDAWIGNRLSALSALNAGVTTLLDWSHIGNSPAHTDAAIEALRDAGVRAVYAFGNGSGPDSAWPDDIRRLRREHFNSDDQLLTLALAAGTDPAHWRIAREIGAPITSHVNGRDTLPPIAEDMGPDNTYIHCTQLSDAEFDLIRETGGGVSIAAPIEMEMGHGEPPLQQVIDRNIPWALSNDVETQIPGEFFTQMQHVFTLQRMNVHTRERRGETEVPPLMTVREVLNVATLGGARVNHLDDRTGSLTPGKAADILMLDMQRINVMPVNNAHGAVVLGMGTSNVRNVFVAGRARKWQGALVDVDLTSLGSQAEASRERIRNLAGWSDSVTAPL